MAFRRYQLIVRDRFFKLIPNENMYQCRIGSCESKLKGIESSLRRHIAHQHSKVAMQIGLTGYSKRQSKMQDGHESPSPKSAGHDEFLTGQLEMIAFHSVPLDFFDSATFEKTIGPAAKNLGIVFANGFINKLISVVTTQIRSLIAAELKDRMFSVKFDVVSYRKRKLLAINVQYINEGKFITRTLSVEDVSSPQSLEVVKSRIDAVLESYQINMCNVYCWITESGKNWVKCDPEKVAMVRVKTEDASSNILDNITYVTVVESNEPNSTKAKIDIKPNVGALDVIDESIIDELYEPAIIEDDAVSDQLIEALETMFLPDEEKHSATIKCGLQTLCFIVQDSLNLLNDDSLLAIRMIVGATRQPEHRRLFELANIPLPKCDIQKRWGSLWSMIESIYKYRIFYEDIGVKIKELAFTPNHWTFIEEFIAAYEPIYKTAESLQTENLTMGDVFKSIKLCQYKIKKISPANRFVEPILQALEARMAFLFEKDLFRVALLFDQRWCFLDSPYYPKESKMLAIDSALKISNTLKRIQNYAVEPVPKEESSREIPEDEFEAMLEEECQNESMMVDTSQIDLKLKLIQLANTKTRKPIATDNLVYWETKKLEDAELYELAMVALGCHASSVTLNQCYDAMNMFKDRQRMGMSLHTLHNIMTLKFNRNLIQTAVESSKQQLLN
ncbi:uncharacterized protein LOC129732804 [Wyeomyia smithii]|uniref:uncharacterized protein LOC129732804 n=1 Tax=Wyeomyia smithii TaxID=174621 RepID=UPI0024680398|nr:uncharacterized protein LOC129732804 [Wyeomyia smithii]XP_055550051.1 uncharacterized protein LOC129732804 [Wyeomyia smithii]